VRDHAQYGITANTAMIIEDGVVSKDG